ncbi:enoyl-CoA hydratase/isomerase family protein [Roseovarius sp. C7]|uniref:enoyl-CoA hydratase/isomerase family protein n=1 Tax=Roseovarius sp. C7 TaxID=3398643 RepID=UPI0039F6BDDE
MAILARMVDGVAILEMQFGATGLLTGDRCRELLLSLDQLQGRSGAEGLVLVGTGDVFCGGFDLVQEEMTDAEPLLAEVCAKLDAFPLPTVALLNGTVRGAGLSLALAANARVATQETRLVFPEIRFAMMPAGGSTQRLSRLLGADLTLRMMLGGGQFDANDPALGPLVDRVLDSFSVAEASDFVKTLADPRQAAERDEGLRDPRAFFAAIAEHRTTYSEAGAAAKAIIRAVEAAALLPFENGLALEAVLGEELAQQPEAARARHRAWLRRLARQPASIGRLVRRPGGGKICLHGQDDEFAKIASLASDAGWPVADPDTPDHAEMLHFVARAEDLPAAEEVVGAVAIVGGQMTGATPKLWFDAPVSPTALIELSTPETEVPHQIVNFLAALRNPVIRTGAESAGGGCRWMRHGYWALGRSLLACGAAPEAVDAAAHRLGFATGPFTMMEQHSGETIARQLDQFAKLSGWRVPTQLASAGKMDEATLGQLFLGGLVNISIAALERGVLKRAADADVLAVHLLGFAPEKGGVLLLAEEQGLLPLLRALQGLRTESGSVLTPVAAFQRMVTEGQGFYSRLRPRALAGA